jgi:hypothetical protein
LARRGERAPPQEQDVVAVEHPTAGPDQNRAVGVAVERHARLATPRHHLLGETLGMERAAAVVDVDAVRAA